VTAVSRSTVPVLQVESLIGNEGSIGLGLALMAG